MQKIAVKINIAHREENEFLHGHTYKIILGYAEKKDSAFLNKLLILFMQTYNNCVFLKKDDPLIEKLEGQKIIETPENPGLSFLVRLFIIRLKCNLVEIDEQNGNSFEEYVSPDRLTKILNKIEA